MKKIKFYVHPKIGKENESTNDKYILLSYFLSDRRSIKYIDITIEELETIASGEKTFEEVYDPSFVIDVGYGAGEFECNKDTAYFISNNPESEPNIEMPLQELIDLLKEWKTFLS